MSPAGEVLRLLASLLGGMLLSDLCPSETAVRRETAQSLGFLFWPIAQFLPNKMLYSKTINFQCVLYCFAFKVLLTISHLLS